MLVTVIWVVVAQPPLSAGVIVAPAGADVRNPAFDVTPAELISGVITDKGIYRAPYSFIYEMRSRD